MAQRTTNHTPDIDSGSWISNIFSYFGGAYLPALKETPSDRSKFVTIGLFVFNTALLAFITMSFALHSVFRSNEEGWLIWVVAGFWAIVIFSIDWGLVKTMKKVPNASWAEFKTYTGIVIPTILRIIVATIISFTISKPLEVKIFENRLGPKIEELKREYIVNERNRLDSMERMNNPLPSLVADKNANAEIMNSIPANVAQLDFRIKSENDNLTQLKNDLNRFDVQRKSLWQKYAVQYCAKMDTLGNCLNYKWRCDNAQYRQVLADISSIRGQIKDVINQVSDLQTARDDSYKQHVQSFKVIDNALNDRVETERQKHEARTQTRLVQDSVLRVRSDSAFQANYLIAQIEALELLAADGRQGKSIFWTKWLIFSIILLVDLMPIFIKLLSPYGPYERVMDDLDAQKVVELRLRKFSVREEYRNNRGLVQRLARSQREVVRKALENWQESKIRKMEEDPEAYREILQEEQEQPPKH